LSSRIYDSRGFFWSKGKWFCFLSN